MRTIKLYGHLGKQFGRTHRFDVTSPAEAARALIANFPDFKSALVGHKRGYHIHVGDDVIDKDLLTFQGGGAIKFVPVVAGAKNGIGQVIVGALIIAAAFYTGGASIAAGGALSTTALGGFALSFGSSLVLGGISSLLIGAPKTGKASNAPENSPNYAFNGPVNTVAQGNNVPVCYGRMIVGSQVISASLTVEQNTGRQAPPTIGNVT